MPSKPKFTDGERYPHGYTHSGATDIRARFARIRREQEAARKAAAERAALDEAERARKVAKIGRKA